MMEKATTPKVSVIIPVYNTEDHLTECLNSITNQTLSDIEIIIVDDGSTDNSYEIAQSFAQKDDRIKVLHQQNKNAGAARNLGLKHATGEYLSFLDSDDYFESSTLEVGYEKASQIQAEIVVWRSRRYIEDTNSFEPMGWTIREKYLPEQTVFAGIDLKENAFLAIAGYVWDKLFKRSYIEAQNINFQSQPVFNDAFFAYAALLNANRITCIDEIFSVQRKRLSKNSISDRRAQYWVCAYTALKKIQDNLQTNGLYERFKRDFANYAVHLLLLDFDTKQGTNRIYMEEAIKRYWAQELDIKSHLGNASYFYNTDQYCRFKSLYEDPLRHSATDFEESLKEALDETRKENSVAGNSLDVLDPIVIPVAFATDENYVFPTAVALTSLFDRAKNTTKYDVYILTDENLSTEAKRILYSIREQYPRHEISFVIPEKNYSQADICIDHITVATYFRLSLASMLPKIDKCIYLDSDIVVRGDLRELYETDLENNLMAGVRALTYCRSEGLINSKKEELGIDDWTAYVNAGVLVINLKLFRAENLEEEFQKLLDRKFTSQDQDILNLVCHNRIKLAPFKFNAMTKYALYDSEAYSTTYLKDWIDEGEWNESRRLPVIIHYADAIKPWNNMTALYAGAWWDVVKTLPGDIQTKIFDKYIDSAIENAEKGAERIKELEFQQRRLLNYLRFWTKKKIKKYSKRVKGFVKRLRP